MFDHDPAIVALITSAPDGRPEGLTRGGTLDNITPFWWANTAASSASLFWESKLVCFAPKGMPPSASIRVFPDEIYAVPRRWTETAYPMPIYCSQLPKGRNFATRKQPMVLTEEIGGSFLSLRQARNTTRNRCLDRLGPTPWPWVSS